MNSTSRGDPVQSERDSAVDQRLLNVGVQHHQAGRLDDALSCYQQVLARNPKDSDALHLSGVVAANRRQYDTAIALIGRALAVKPDEAVFHTNLGNALLQHGQVMEAISAYDMALRLRPGDSDVRQNLRHACDRRFAQAVEHYGADRFSEANAACNQVLDSQPDRAAAWHLSGAIAEACGDPDRSAERIQRAISIAPDQARFHHSLGVLMLKQGRHESAAECFRRATALEPSLIDAHINLAVASHAKGQLKDALDSLRKALALDPTHVEALIRFADLLRVEGRHEEAIAAARHAVDLAPNDARTHGQLGVVLRSVGHATEAIQACQRSIEIAPNTPGTYNNLAMLLKDQARMGEAIKCYRHSLEIDPANATVHSNLLFNLHYTEPHDAAAIFAEHRQWARLHGAAQTKIPSFAEVDRSSERRLRVGYVSADLKTHSVAFFLEPILAARDRSTFEVFCYSNGATADTTTARLRALSDAWRDIAGLDDEQAAALIRSDSIDILVDLAGHTKGNRLQLFTLKPAPVQVSYLGYPNTTGLATVDYRLTDERVDPLGQTEQFYTEKLVYLPYGFLCYQPPESCPDVTPLPMLQSGRVTFGSFNNLAKLSPTVIAHWAEILRAVPNSRLLLKSKALADSGTRQYLKLQFRERGVDASQLDMIGWTKDRLDHMGLYGEVDIALDTFPYHGVTTTCEALWMGVPVLTLAGRAHVSRVGVSLLSAAGMDEFVCDSPDQYILKAIGMAGDANRLADLRNGLRARLKVSPLTDARRISASIEVAYRGMWRRFCSAAVPPVAAVPALRLHIGGKVARDGWKILNIQPGPHVDFVGDCVDLSAFADSSVEEIYASHVLEHLGYRRDLLRALSEFFRVLRPAGSLRISVPDLETLCVLFTDPTIGDKTRFQLMRMMFGGQVDAYDLHKVGCYQSMMVDYLRRAGFAGVARVNEHGLFDDASSLRVGQTLISLNLVATKAATADQELVDTRHQA
jgi:protein O-GlcNAc transferase